MKLAGRIIFIALLILLAWLVVDRFFISEKARVRRTMTALQKAVENGDLLKLSSLITQNYEDEWGMNKTSLLGVCQMLHKNAHAFKVELSQVTITVNGNEAEAGMFADVKATDEKGAAMDLTQELRAQAGGRLRLKFVKTDDGWKLKRAEAMKLHFD